MQNNNPNINSEYLLELSALEEQGNQRRLSNDFTIQHRPANVNSSQEQVSIYSKNIPTKASVIFGTGSAIAGYTSNAILPSSEYKHAQKILQSFIGQAIGNAGMSTLTLPFAEKTNVLTENILNVSASTIGGICGVLAQKVIKEYSQNHIDNKELQKAISDFTLLSVFVFMQLASKPHIKALCNQSQTFQNIANADVLKIKNIPSKTINFFINTISGAVGAYCTSEYMASQNINDTVKTFTAGEIFSTAQNTTKVILTSLYNKLTGNNIYR